MTALAHGGTTIRNLQLMRAVAAYMVVAHHFFEYPRRYIEGWPTITVGAAGVDVFFVISGIVMAITTADKPVDPLTFLARRAWRIVPLYWLFTTIVLAMLLAGMHPLGMHVWTLGDVLGSYLFQPSANGPILVVGWTLNFEMLFYLFVAVTLALRGRDLKVVSLVGALTLCALIGGLLGVRQWSGAATYAELLFSSLLLEFVAGFVLGTAYHRLRERVYPVRMLRALGATAIAAAVAGLAYAAQLDHLPADLRAVVLGLPALALCAGALLLERAGVAVQSRVWLFLGDASFAIYLAHPLIGQAFEKSAVRLVPQTPSTVIATIVASVLATTLVAALVHLGIERPLQRAGRAAPGWRAAFATRRDDDRPPAEPIVAPTQLDLA